MYECQIFYLQNDRSERLVIFIKVEFQCFEFQIFHVTNIVLLIPEMYSLWEPYQQLTSLIVFLKIY
jgi:hypothetical protein